MEFVEQVFYCQMLSFAGTMRGQLHKSACYRF